MQSLLEALTPHAGGQTQKSILFPHAGSGYRVEIIVFFSVQGRTRPHPNPSPRSKRFWVSALERVLIPDAPPPYFHTFLSRRKRFFTQKETSNTRMDCVERVLFWQPTCPNPLNRDD